MALPTEGTACPGKAPRESMTQAAAGGTWAAKGQEGAGWGPGCGLEPEPGMGGDSWAAGKGVSQSSRQLRLSKKPQTEWHCVGPTPGLGGPGEKPVLSTH